jgi:hypothetical protein
MSEMEKKARYLTSYRNSFQIRDLKGPKKLSIPCLRLKESKILNEVQKLVPNPRFERTTNAVNSMSEIEKKARYFNELQKLIPSLRLKGPQTS